MVSLADLIATKTGNNFDNTLFGTKFNDVIFGLVGNDLIFGNAGDDHILGGYGNDIIFGGNGNDKIHGDQGNDIIDAGAGNDYIFDSDNVADVIDGGAGWDLLNFQYRTTGVSVNLMTNSTGNGDEIYNIEAVVGSEFADVLKGDSEKNHLRGMVGDDLIEGGLGGDVLTGGLGSDQFLYQDMYDSSKVDASMNRDIIVDFETGVDQIVLDSTFANIADVTIRSVSGVNMVELTGTDFSILVKDTIDLSDIVVAAI